MEDIKAKILDLVDELSDEQLLEVSDLVKRVSNGMPALYPDLKIGDFVKCKLCNSKSQITDAVTVNCKNCGDISMDNTEEY